MKKYNHSFSCFVTYILEGLHGASQSSEPGTGGEGEREGDTGSVRMDFFGFLDESYC